jgi:hypothetical protein
VTSQRARPPAREQSAGEALSSLAVAALVSSDVFRVELQRCSVRAIELWPVITDPGAPAGLWLRTAGADHLYYESQTSPFHQADILLTLAARLLLGDKSGVTLDSRLVPDLSPEMVRLILGADARIAETHHGSERLAYQAMEHAHRRLPGPAARRLLRELQPLHATLLDAVPQAAHEQVPGRPGPRVRLHRTVIEIREAVLALRPYVNPQPSAAASKAVHAPGLAGDELAAAVEASVLAAAVQGRVSDTTACVTGGIPRWQHMPRPDLHSEAAWLVRVARAFDRDSLAR